MADPITLPTNQGLVVKFTNLELVQTSGANDLAVPGNYEGATGQPGGNLQGNWGIVAITQSSMPSTRISTARHTEELVRATSSRSICRVVRGVTGIFYGIDLTSGTTAKGGFLDLYWSDTPVADTATATPSAATVATFTSGDFLARIQFVPGELGPGDCTSTIESTTSLGTSTPNGFATSYGDVAVGATVGGNTGAWEDC